LQIDSIYYFNYSKEIGFYDSIRDFRSEEMTYIGLALSTPKIRVNASPTKYAINEIGSVEIREFVIARLEQLNEISQTLAENSPKYILICCSDDTKHYYTYDEDFCSVFEIAKKYKPEEKSQDTYVSPYAIQKSEVNYTRPIQPTTYTTTTPARTYTTQRTPTYSTATPKDERLPWGKIILGLVIGLVLLGILISNVADDNDSYLTPVSEPYSGAILAGSEIYDESEITVKASGGESCVVKLKTRYGTERLSFYVRAGDVVTVGVPCEYLYVYFASGDTWYGEDLLFGEDTSYQKVKDLENFADYTWEYTLYPVSNGNLSLSQVDADEF